MNNLFVDDDENRFLEFLRRQPKGHDNINILATSYKGAVASLGDTDGWDVVWLDNDLGEGSSNDGYKVAEYIVSENLLPDATYIVHSMNPVRSSHIHETLHASGRKVHKIPGGWKKAVFHPNGRLSFIP